jgi:thiol-disulfide isomerase/thioredoxin
MSADFAETDAEGMYSLQLAAGPVRITHQGQSEDGQGFIPEPGELAFVVAPDGSTIAPDLTLRPMPKIRGRVIDEGGRPVENAVVRLRGSLRWMQPVATDVEGRFELAPPFVPQDFDTEEDRPEQPLVAFHPYQRLAGRITVRLTDPAELLGDLTITLAPEEPGWLFSNFDDELTPFEKGKISAERSGELLKLSPIAKTAPSLEGTWLNVESESRGLEAFAGRFVLLDFWFTGCGPCHADFPSVKLLHELYRDHGVEIVAVHDNSALPEAVRDHAEQEHLNFPIIVDESDGRTIRRYEEHGLNGYPSYMLLGPDGTVIDDDDTSPSPSLRSYKIELIRERLLGGND